ncbi:DUF5132 domain-containing protein [Streptomyces sp. NPDC088246]|uniref:DUF5132 domain-containing protein n=1 Tax=Streptomyces sp. NPDC088246 TaxID=3365842 RepID=UPI00381EAB27
MKATPEFGTAFSASNILHDEMRGTGSAMREAMRVITFSCSPPAVFSIIVFSTRREGCRAMPPVVPPFLIGLIAASLVKRLGKPLMRGIVKTSVGLGIEAKRAVHEASVGIQDLAAEATAEMLAAQMTHGAEHGTDTGAPEGGTAGRTGAGTGSAPAAAAAHAAQAGSESKGADKARGAGSAAATVR